MRIESNYKLKAKQIKRYARRMSQVVFKEAMHASLESIGNTAVKNYMDAKAKENILSPSGEKLSVRSGRLAASLVGAYRFTESKLPPTVTQYLGGDLSFGLAGSGKGKKESIRIAKMTGSRIEGIIGSKVPYAEIQEKGGTTHPKVTPKSRKFFWFMHFLTDEEKWMMMALTSRQSFNVKIPPKPYLKPAAQESMPTVEKIFEESIKGEFRKEDI